MVLASSSVKNNPLADALGDILAGGSASSNVASASVWPVEEVDPASGFTPFGNALPTAGPITTGEPVVIVKTEVVTVTVTVTGAPSAPGTQIVTKTVEEEADCTKVCDQLMGDILDNVKCPAPVDCAAVMAKEAAASAAASAAANVAAQAAMTAAAGMPSQAALDSQKLVNQALQAAAASRDYAQRAYAAATESKTAVTNLRSDLYTAAAARAAELNKVVVVPPSISVPR